MRLGAVAFLVGGATLATEIAASRLLAPYFGASTVVWANIIGLTLAYLAVGYWLGGRLADRRPEPSVLAVIPLGAALLAGRAWMVAPVVLAALLAVPPPEIKRSLFETESEYQYIRVVDDGHGGRELELNEGVVSHSAWRPDTVLTGRYWDLFLLF